MASEDETTVEEAAKTIERALVSQLARLLAEHRAPPGPKKWWERGGYIAAVGAIIAAVGPLTTAGFDIYLDTQKHRHEIEIDGEAHAHQIELNDRARREKYLQLVINAASNDERQQVLDMIIGAPWSSVDEVAWAIDEKARELGQVEAAKQELARQQVEVDKLNEELAYMSKRLSEAINGQRPTNKIEREVDQTIAKLSAAERRADGLSHKLAGTPKPLVPARPAEIRVTLKPLRGSVDRMYLFVDEKKKIGADASEPREWKGFVTLGDTKLRVRVFGAGRAQAELRIEIAGQPPNVHTLAITNGYSEFEFSL